MPHFVPTGLAGDFIVACWAIFLVTWLVAAFFTKRTVERSWSSWQFAGIAAFLLIVAALGSRGIPALRHLDFAAWDYVWPRTPFVAIAADIVTGLGLLITLWARYTLGANWSGTVTFKENHELVTGGPYAFVRHPIYTGLLTMLLGALIINGHALGFGVLAIAAAVYWLKAQDEERLMIKHFPDAYPLYKARVRALVPFLF
jgi:protein-S-isoprenylcysteine O-methyltransferase Ste14